MAEDRIVIEGKKGGAAATMWGQFGMADCVDAAMDATQAIGLMGSVDMALRESQFTKLPIGHDSVLLLRQVGQPRM
jgi:hypothetical protein